MSYSSPSNTSARERVCVIHPVLKSERGMSMRGEESALQEACGLAAAIDLEIFSSEIIYLPKISPATYIGGGKADEIKQALAQHKIGLLFVNTSLSPGQQRNLETACKVKVIDRTGMILEIFGARARTHEGRLQVELAALSFQRSRLVRSWTHLERQRGGHGFLGGPGEKQLELDRRMLEARIEKIKIELSNVVRTRRLHRKSRERNRTPTIALIGYTNAGKSTLFNRLTQSDVLSKDMLFATLDPTIRPLQLPRGRKVVLSDTVGFISDLPTQLVAAFRATLEEVVDADLLLHVRDISSPESDAQKADVEAVLNELGISEQDWRSRLIEVWNKVDLIESGAVDSGDSFAVKISSITGQGIDQFLHAVENRLEQGLIHKTVHIPSAFGDAVGWLYRHAQIIGRIDNEEHSVLEITIEPAVWEKFKSKFKDLSIMHDSI